MERVGVPVRVCTCFGVGDFAAFPKRFRRVSSPRFGFPRFVGLTMCFILYLIVFVFIRMYIGICIWPNA